MENLEQSSKINFNGSQFVKSLRVPDLLTELRPETRRFRFDVSEAVSNLDRMFSQIFRSREEIETVLDDVLSGKKKSLTPIKLPQEIRDGLRDLFMEKISEKIEKP